MFTGFKRHVIECCILYMWFFDMLIYEILWFYVSMCFMHFVGNAE